ncbi:MAG TPA: hypothetical protein VF587_09350, partial [Solirubrobacteraceae bacterium]
MSVEQRFRTLRAPGEEDAQRRAWEVAAAALDERRAAGDAEVAGEGSPSAPRSAPPGPFAPRRVARRVPFAPRRAALAAAAA